MDIVYAEKYYKQVKERFPMLSEKQIDKIIKYGLRSFFAHNKFGGDVLLKSNYYTGYVGRLFINMKWFAIYYVNKMKLKLRIKYKRSKTVFNGKYYFGFKEHEYQEWFGGSKRKHKILNFPYIKIYKLYDECALYKPDYIFEFDHEDEGFYKKKTKFKISRYHLVSKRDKNGILQPVGKEVKYKWNKRQ